MRSMHQQPCKACPTGHRRSHEDLCDKCHLANGGKFCQCGAHIERTDSVCRSCWTSQTRNLPGSMNTWDGLRENDAPSVDLERYRMETTQVGMISAEDDGEFYMGLISDQAREGLKKWRQKKAQS